MQLINIFNTGGLTLGLTLFWAVLSVVFLYQAFQARKSGWSQQTPEGIKEGKEKIKLTKIPQFILFLILTGAYLIAMVFVAIDYMGV